MISREAGGSCLSWYLPSTDVQHCSLGVSPSPQCITLNQQCRLSTDFGVQQLCYCWNISCNSALCLSATTFKVCRQSTKTSWAPSLCCAFSPSATIWCELIPLVDLNIICSSQTLNANVCFYFPLWETRSNPLFLVGDGLGSSLFFGSLGIYFCHLRLFWDQ